MRWAWRILLCLALGVTTTVVIAWAMAIRPGNPVGTGGASTDLIDHSGLQAWQADVNLLSRAGQDHVLLRIRPNGYVPVQTAGNSVAALVTGWRRQLTGPWLDDLKSAPQRASTVTLSSYGWPWRTMYAIESNERGWSEWSLLWQPDWLTGVWGAPVAGGLVPPGFPVGLVPIQFPAAVLLWAGAWGVPLFGLGAARRGRRRRAGRCVQCGYDRRDLAADAPCPECGTLITPVRHKSG